jgi:hypothetical protein
MTQSPSHFIFGDNLHARVRVVYQFNASFYVSYYHGTVTLLVVTISVPSHICFFACLVITNQSHGQFVFFQSQLACMCISVATRTTLSYNNVLRYIFLGQLTCVLMSFICASVINHDITKVMGQ